VEPFDCEACVQEPEVALGEGGTAGEAKNVEAVAGSVSSDMYWPERVFCT